MSLHDAQTYLEQVRTVVNRLEPTVRLEVGMQPANNANLNYKVFQRDQRLTDFELFGLIPKDLEESNREIETAFEKYWGFAQVIN